MGSHTIYTICCVDCDFKDEVCDAAVELAVLPDSTQLILPREPSPLLMEELLDEEMGAAGIDWRKAWKRVWKTSCLCLACGNHGMYGLRHWKNEGFLDSHTQRVIPTPPEEPWRWMPHILPDRICACPYFRCLACRRPTLISFSNPIVEFVSFFAMFLYGRYVRCPIPCPKCGSRKRKVTANFYIT